MCLESGESLIDMFFWMFSVFTFQTDDGRWRVYINLIFLTVLLIYVFQKANINKLFYIFIILTGHHKTGHRNERTVVELWLLETDRWPESSWIYFYNFNHFLLYFVFKYRFFLNCVGSIGTSLVFGIKLNIINLNYGVWLLNEEL